MKYIFMLWSISKKRYLTDNGISIWNDFEEIDKVYQSLSQKEDHQIHGYVHTTIIH